MAKIASKLDASLLARGDGWTVHDVVCTSGPADHPFEEEHSTQTVAIVLGGTFQYRSGAACELMTPGSILLGNAGQPYRCGHEHGSGDRCISFAYAPEFFERVAFDVARRTNFEFQVLRLPPVRALSRVTALAASALAGSPGTAWEELGTEVAAQALQLDGGFAPDPAGSSAASIARVTRAVRLIENDPGAPHDLASLALEARLSLYCFLRTFKKLTGQTPHQYLLRVKLRRAAIRLQSGRAKILDVALDCGFSDISNFNRMFRAEFGHSPRSFREHHATN